MAHGGGGRLMHQLIEKMFVSVFKNDLLESRHDSAVLNLPSSKIAFTTDSFVVQPLFFPGGDIGQLAVYGTVNDLAMSGARPAYLSASFVLEEGLSMETLWRVAQSMARASRRTKTLIVTGDTKVVDRGKGDQIFINTSGIGLIEHSQTIAPVRVRPGDFLLLNGDLGRHGMAIMAAREGLEFETTIKSDAAPLAELVLALLAADVELHCLRDLTRGGLASALNEIASTAGVSISLEETRIPVRKAVRAACELLGLDPLHVANEGRLVAFVPQTHVARALRIMRNHSQGRDACLIGHVTDEPGALVTMTNQIGATRVVDMLSGEQLPRIC
ncbi:MAG: hydrogenase expression/formation protein HypE [Planctomycetota bacterium]